MSKHDDDFAARLYGAPMISLELALIAPSLLRLAEDIAAVNRVSLSLAEYRIKMLELADRAHDLVERVKG